MSRTFASRFLFMFLLMVALTAGNVSAASTTLVISQAYGGGGGTTGTYMNDYVELKNISSTPQSLNGLSLMYGSATGQFGSSATNIFALPNVVLNPGQYFLVQLSTAGTGGVALPVTPDASSTNLSMSGTNGKVALTNGLAANSCGATATPCTLPNAQIVDLVAWGTSNNAEGGASTNGGAALTSVQGSVRKTAGCTDTDNNNLDFDVVTAPVPRNTASPVATCGTVAPRRANVDFNGDGKSDYAIIRNENNQLVWYILTNGGGAAAYAWGLFNSDRPVPADWDGDGKSDIAVWREAPATQARFYILQSGTNTVRITSFGQTGDDPSVVGDYDGDGKADEATYRCPTVFGQCTWFYRGSLNNPSGNVTYVPWGSGTPGTALPVAGDYDGDGKYDFCVRPNSIPTPMTTEGNSVGQFVLLRSADFGVEYITWGFNTDLVVPASDFDGDGKTDIAVARPGATNFELYILERDGGGTGAAPILFGSPAADDDAAFGDYDGDGRQDVGIWRAGQFWIRQSSNGAVVGPAWGQLGDFTAASWFFPRS